MSTFAPHPRVAGVPLRPNLRLVSPRAEEAEGAGATADQAPSGTFRRRQHVFDIRPIRPEDAELIVAAIAYTSDETYYRRFHTAKRSFSTKELSYLTNVDGRTHVALVAIDRGASPRLAAVARFCTADDDPSEAEFAICVHDPFRRCGLGAELLCRLSGEASSRGITRLRAMVQSDNVAMRGLLYHVFPDASVDDRCGNEVDYVMSVRPAPLPRAA
jgi:GNAT superfamily N-acetyltransferase